MGLLDPVYDGVNTVIAGAGSVAGSAVSSVGNGISSTGRGLGETVTHVGTSWGDYAKDTGNYIMDATKGPGSRVGTRSNPLGLERSQKAAINFGMNTAGTYNPGPKRPALPPAKKSTTGTAAARSAGAGAKKPAGTTGPGVGTKSAPAKKPAAATGAGVPKKPATGTAPGKAPATANGLGSGKTRVSAESRPKRAKAGTAAKK